MPPRLKFFWKKGKLKRRWVKMSGTHFLEKQMLCAQLDSLVEKNLALVQENTTLLLEINLQKNKRNELSRMFFEALQKMNELQSYSTKIETLLLDVTKDRQEISDLQKKSDDIYTNMIDKVKNQLQNFNLILTTKVSLENEGDPEAEVNLEDKAKNDLSVRKSSAEIFAQRKSKLIDTERLNRVSVPKTELSKISEQSQEQSSTVLNRFIQSPTLMFQEREQSRNASVNEYDLSDCYEGKSIRTPSIYDFEVSKMQTAIFGKSFNDFNCSSDSETIIEDNDENRLEKQQVLDKRQWESGLNGIVNSTPIHLNPHHLQIPKSYRRSSFKTIYDSSFVSSHASFKENTQITENTETTSTEVTSSEKTSGKKRKKRKMNKLNELNSSLSILTSNNSLNNTSYMLRSRACPVYYKEPPANRRLRRGDPEWCREQKNS